MVLYTPENTLLLTELKLMGVERSQVEPAGTPKGSESTVVWFFPKKMLKR
jgi:hypothetical protein